MNAEDVDALSKFAADVRERCAKVCDAIAEHYHGEAAETTLQTYRANCTGKAIAAKECAQAIRDGRVP